MKPKNLTRVYKVFSTNYKVVPLETFHDHPYKTLISTLLSARTNDDTTLKVCKEKLFPKAPNFKELNKLSVEEIQKLIYPVGFYKTKARHLKALAEKVLREFKGKVPNTKEDLISLPGVGRKTANLVLNRAFNIPTIAVDTHVHRISNMLGWVKSTRPEDTEGQLTRVLPQKYWSDINRYMVSIGRQFRSKEKLKAFLEDNKLI